MTVDLHYIEEMRKKYGSLTKASLALGKNRDYFSAVLRRAGKSARSSKRVARDLDEFRRQFDRDVIVPEKIKRALAAVAKRGDVWIPEAELREMAQLSTVTLAQHRDVFADVIVEVDSRRIWFVDKKYADQARRLRLL